MTKSRLTTWGLLTVGLFWLGPDARASILTFAIDPSFGTTGPMPADYGDRIVNNTTDANPATTHTYDTSNGATPNVELSYSSTRPDGQQRFFTDSEWPGVAYLVRVNTPESFDFLFTPDLGYGVRINSFVLDNYAAFKAGSTASWTVYGGPTTGHPVLASSGGSVSLTDGQNLLQTTGLSSFHNGAVLLRVTHETGGFDDLALDSLSFNQILIPEPASGAGLLIVCGVLARRRYRL